MIARGPKYETAEPYLPDRISLPTMRQAVQQCRGCDLYKHATQAVFGEGRKGSIIMMIGEQPGDAEDLKGRPFVGPAGKMLDKMLDEVGIDRQDVYVTNAVKHFKHTVGGTRGKRRIHAKPTAGQIHACRPWLESEMQAVKPRMLVALGATAAQAVFGLAFRVSMQRGQPQPSDLAPWAVATVHPSSLLRAPESEARRLAREMFLRDLKVIARQYRREKQLRATARI